MTDDFDPLLFRAFKEQPPELKPVEALRNAIKAVFSDLSESEITSISERFRLILSVPELRASFYNSFAQNFRIIFEAIAERTGKKSDDFAISVISGAFEGVVFAVWSGA